MKKVWKNYSKIMPLLSFLYKKSISTFTIHRQFKNSIVNLHVKNSTVKLHVKKIKTLRRKYRLKFTQSLTERNL